jgi:nucleoid DNA-binding protein
MPAKKSSKSTKKSGKKAMSQSEFIGAVAEEMVLDKATVRRFFEVLGSFVGKRLKADGVVRVPGLVRLTVTHRKAIPAGKWMNPFTKQEEHRKAKPASKSVRARPTKALKDAVG